MQAVARHTVGAPDMTDLDMVVYLADMIEPAATYPGVDELREAVGDGLALRELFALGYQLSVMHLVRDAQAASTPRRSPCGTRSWR